MSSEVSDSKNTDLDAEHETVNNSLQDSQASHTGTNDETKPEEVKTEPEGKEPEPAQRDSSEPAGNPGGATNHELPPVQSETGFKGDFEEGDSLSENTLKTPVKLAYGSPGFRRLLGIEEHQSHDPSHVERLFQFKQLSNERTQQLAEDLQNEVMSHCTFAPDIEAKRDKRVFTEFLEDQHAHEAAQKERLAHLKANKAKALKNPAHFRPTIDGKSANMNPKRPPPEQVFNSLYALSRPEHVPTIAELIFNSLFNLNKPKPSQVTPDLLVGSLMLGSVLGLNKPKAAQTSPDPSQPSSGPVLNSLSSLKKSAPAKTSPEKRQYNFIPRTNPRARKQKLSCHITEHLYQQGVNRANRTLSYIPPQAPVHLNTNSKKYVIGKFIREYNKIFDFLDVRKRKETPYSLYIILLQDMNFIVNNHSSGTHQDERYLVLTAWNSIVSTKTIFVEKQVLLDFLLALMGYIKGPQTQGLSEKYALFLLNRKVLPPNDLSRFTVHSGYPFAPTLSKRTRQLAAHKQRQRQGSKSDFLVNERQKLIEKWKRMQMEREKAADSALVFTPTVKNKLYKKNPHQPGTKACLWRNLRDRSFSPRTDSLFSLSLLLQEQDAESDYEHSEDFNECTFTPSINKRSSSSAVEFPVRGTEDFIKRMKNARKLRRTKKNLAEARLPSANHSITDKSFLSTSFSSITKGNNSPGHNAPVDALTPDSSEDNEGEWPLLIDVTLPSGGMDMLVVEDEAHKVAAVENFIKKHSLPPLVAEELRKGI